VCLEVAFQWLTGHHQSTSATIYSFKRELIEHVIVYSDTTLREIKESTMSGLFGSANPSTGTAAANNTTGDISKDVTLTAPPEDSISDLSFSPISEHLAVASWDKKVRIYEINAQGGSEGKALFEHEAPVLSVCWSKVSSASFYSSY